MDFNLTEEHLMIQQAARDFAQIELLPGVIERDEFSKFPTEQVKKMAELGFMGMMVDPKYGGSGLDSVSYVLAMTEIAKVDASAAVIMSVNNSLVCAGLEKYCNEEQKIKYLTPLAKGDVIGAFCLSEPEAGSDATSQKTTAIDKGDYYLLNGTKNWITNGSSASIYIVIAQTDVEKGHKGINAFIVEKAWAGFDIGPKEKKMGIRGSDTHSLMFTDVKVPKENRIGADGFGFNFAMAVLNGGRIGIASQALGIATGAYELALKYSQERKAFGKEMTEYLPVIDGANKAITNPNAMQVNNAMKRCLVKCIAICTGIGLSLYAGDEFWDELCDPYYKIKTEISKFKIIFFNRMLF